MKALDEVVKALEMCMVDNCVCLSGCPYSYLADGEDGCEYHAIPAMQKDALHYLKEYWEKQNILKGKWQITSIKSETWGVCSNCGFKQKAGELNFCPNCGADMRGNDGTNKN